MEKRMDYRKILESGTELSFPGMVCTIDSFIGKGSNAMVYLGSYPDEQAKQLRHRVLIKELFPYHPQGKIYRSQDQAICLTEDAKEVMELHRFSFMRGNEIHVKLLKEHPEDIDFYMNTFSFHQTLYSILGFSGGRSLEKEQERRKSSEGSLALLVRRMLGILDVLEEFHHAGLLHMDISPDNILLIGEGKRERISLIDYNSVHTIQEIQTGEAVYFSEKEGYTAPEIRLRKISEIGFASDLYALTAVFYYLLMGKSLSVLQTVRGQVPNVTDAPCLLDMPDTVCSMVRKILKRGLSSLVSRRYQTIDQIREDLEELQDRIEGKGITHPALWEMGKANVLRIVQNNPALSYIKEEEHVYPIMVQTEQEEAISLSKLISQVLSADGESVLLLGAGGAGKTTALLRSAYLQPKKYNDATPAFLYLSLYGWTEGTSSYIKDRILENLKFKPDTPTMETARHELIRLLSNPMDTKMGECPKLLLLLDGWNEISGDTKELVQEITELSQMHGVRIFLTSRSEAAEIPFQRVSLRLLKEAEVREILAQNGILPPEQEGFFRLLCSPMMLSIYIRTALDQKKQLFITTQDQLFEQYFAAILEKERRELPENSAEYWQVEAALSYVLPELAKLISKKEKALSDAELLFSVKKCYRRLKAHWIFRVFPQWVGHLSDIRDQTQYAEEWHGRMVQEILWRRLGFLVRDEQRQYRISHQLMEEYLVKIQKNFERKMVFYERMQRFIFTTAGTVVLLSAYQWIYLPYRIQNQQIQNQIEERVPYEKVISENILDSAYLAYFYCAEQYRVFSDLVNYLQENRQENRIEEADYLEKIEQCEASWKIERTIRTEQTEGYLEILFASGEVMPWSKKPLNKELYQELIDLPKERAEEYQEYLDLLLWSRADQELWSYFGDTYLDALDALLEVDAYLLGSYYVQIIKPELEAMEQSDSEEEKKSAQIYRKSLAESAAQAKITDSATAPIENYKKEKTTALQEIRQNGLVKKYHTREEKSE